MFMQHLAPMFFAAAAFACPFLVRKWSMLLAIIPFRPFWLWVLLLTRGRCVSTFATHVTFATLATLATLVTGATFATFVIFATQISLANLFTFELPLAHCFPTAYCCDKTSLSQEDTYTPPL
jgi:hypothetical protein